MCSSDLLRNPDRVEAVVLSNTGVAVPAGRRAPAVIRLAATGPITDVVGHRTRIFVDGTLALSGRRISRVAREAFRAPYRRREFRRAIAEFVDDVPFDTNAPSAVSIAAVADGIRSLTMPVLLTWGAKDPVFNDDFALDLADRMPQADRHRYPGGGHLGVEEHDIAAVIDAWLADAALAGSALADSALAGSAVANSAVANSAGTDADSAVTDAAESDSGFVPVWAALDARAAGGSADDPLGADRAADAFVDGATGVRTSFAELHRRVTGLAGGLASVGV